MEAYARWMSTPVSGASLAVFRISVGLVMALEAWSLWRPNRAAISSGTTPLQTYYTGSDISFHFPYGAFEWLPLFSPTWIHALTGLLLVASITMALGLFYRISAILVFCSWGYLFAVESTRTYWQSHYYLETLLTFLLIWLPAARRYSMDTWLGRSRAATPFVPFWTIALLRGQLVIAYFYAGVSKLNADWLIDAVPVRWYLARESILTPYKAYLPESWIHSLSEFIRSPALAYFFSYAGAAFDLAIGFLLLARRTRIFAIALMAVFHATNHFVIFDDIDWFPLVGFFSALIFLDPDWPERARAWVRKPHLPQPDRTWLIGGAIIIPVLGGLLGWKVPRRSMLGASGIAVGKSALLFVVGWLAFQTLLPLRHYLIAGDGRFTYEGLSFSWRLKADVHHAFGVQLFVDDPALLGPGPGGQTRIDWNLWKGEKVLYRRIVPGTIDWRTMPEILVVLEPILGERIFFNPWPSRSMTAGPARQRAGQLWTQLYGRAPTGLSPALPLSELLARPPDAGAGEADTAAWARLAAYMQAFESGRVSPFEARRVLGNLRSMLGELKRNEPSAPFVNGMWRLNPFALEGELPSTAPFLLLDDPMVAPTRGEVTANAWQSGLVTHRPTASGMAQPEAEPLTILVGDLGVETKERFPSAYVLELTPQQTVISWNVLKDLSSSKGLHVSNHAFYLRRYARRVAHLWEQRFGRRPRVRALTAVSLNGRPHQALVDPTADLAAVPAYWWRHNRWINDLQTPRIPAEAIPSARGLIGPD